MLPIDPRGMDAHVSKYDETQISVVFIQFLLITVEGVFIYIDVIYTLKLTQALFVRNPTTLNDTDVVMTTRSSRFS